MSKLYEKYKTLKKIKSNSTLYLFPYGIFFIFLEDDARLVSQALGLKLGNLNDSIVKCGFPINSLEKYSNLLKNLGYNVEVIDMKSDKTYSCLEYLHNEQLANLMNEICDIDINNLAIREVYDLLYKIQDTFSSILKKGGKNE